MPDIWFKYNLNILVILLTNKLASIITDKYGNTNDRTTNKMPYPSDLDEERIRITKLFYMSAQFGASCFAIYGDKTLCFMPLLGIQISPFMMTLIKKNKIITNTYHLVYSLGLYINYPIWLIVCFNNLYNNNNVEDLVLIGLCYYIVVLYKFKYNLNKYICWTLGRKRTLTKEQLFLGAMMLYPKWYDPFSDRLCSLEEVLSIAEAQSRSWREDHNGWRAHNIRLWKRKTFRSFFGQYGRIDFSNAQKAMRKVSNIPPVMS